MLITEIMTDLVVTVEMDDTLGVVKEIFDNVRFHHLLVVNRNVLVGVISDRDLLRSISPHIDTVSENRRDLQTLDRKVHQVMSRKLVTLRETAYVRDAIGAFNKNNISCIPIVNEAMEPKGIVSWRDIFKAWGR